MEGNLPGRRKGPCASLTKLVVCQLSRDHPFVKVTLFSSMFVVLWSDEAPGPDDGVLGLRTSGNSREGSVKTSSEEKTFVRAPTAKEQDGQRSKVSSTLLDHSTIPLSTRRQRSLSLSSTANGTLLQMMVPRTLTSILARRRRTTSYLSWWGYAGLRAGVVVEQTSAHGQDTWDNATLQFDNLMNEANKVNRVLAPSADD